MSKGTIGVTSENLFPIIKKFLYSDHEIFLLRTKTGKLNMTTAWCNSIRYHVFFQTRKNKNPLAKRVLSVPEVGVEPTRL